MFVHVMILTHPNIDYARLVVWKKMLSNPLQHIGYNSLNKSFVICNAQLIMISSMLIT